jgi:ABC-type multidrug transport system permease subunit
VTIALDLTCRNVCRERANGCYGAFTYSLAALLVALPFIFLLSVAAGSICYGCLQLNDKEGRFFLFIVNLFVTLAVAESVIALISTIVPFFIVGIAAGAFTFGGFMVVEGFFIKVEDIPPAWRWMHWIAFHSYSFANFMYIEFDGRVIGPHLFHFLMHMLSFLAHPMVFSPFELFPLTGADLNAVPPSPQDFDGELVLKAFEFEDQDVWLNIGIMASMLVVYRLLGALWSHFFHLGKK